MAYKRTGETVEMLWDCPNCGTTGILARNKKCPNCGKSRSGSTYLGDNPDSRILSEEEKSLFTGQADWYCSYCDTLNSSNRDTCVNCGSLKSVSEYDYFDIKDKEQEEEIRESVGTANYGDESGEYSEHGSQESDKTEKVEKAVRLIQHVTSYRFRQTISLIRIIFFVVITLGFMIFVNIPRDDTIEIQGISWKRQIDIEKLTTVNDSGWTLPLGARLKYTREEWHHNDHKIVGYDKKYSYVDNGDGTSDKVYEEEPIYEDEPVYMTKYYYEIDKYVHSRYVETSGTDHEVYWGDVSLGWHEREGRRSETYSVKALNNKDKTKTYSLSYSDWKNLNIGEKVNVKINMLGQITSIE